MPIEFVVAVLGSLVMALVVTGCFTGGLVLFSKQDEMLRREEDQSRAVPSGHASRNEAGHVGSLHH